MNRYTTKTRVNLTINKELYEKFVEFSKKNSINKSLLIENYIKEYLEKNEGK